MNLYTEVNFPSHLQKLNYKSRSVFIGSCFSENIGGWLANLKFDVSSNKLGTTYNPLSISRQIDRTLAGEAMRENDLVETPAGIAHFDFHSTLNHSSKKAYINNANQCLAGFSEELAAANFLFITFGTAIAYEHIASGKVVNNCHKIAGNEFRKKFLTEDEMFQVLSKSLRQLRKQNPSVKIILTVSPIRHLRNGARDNMRSKARLIRLCEMLENERDCSYLPVYEVVMDQLRDYRFYRQDDLLHLNELGSSIIKAKFTEAMINPSTYSLMKRVGRWQNMKDHKVMQPGSLQAKAFDEKLQQEEKALKTLLPGRF